MLEKKIRRKIYGRLNAIAEGMREDIGFMTERLGIIEAIMLLYYYDNEEDLNGRDEEDENLADRV